MRQTALEHAYVLHYRSYRDTSLLVDFFTQTQGRIRAVARGARSKKSRNKGLLQPFSLIMVNWVGKNDLVTLCDVDSTHTPHVLQGNSILAGFYLNELLYRLLHNTEPLPELFASYRQTLSRLEHGHPVEVTLRLFEKDLLQILGYGLVLAHESESEISIDVNKKYAYVIERGPIPHTDAKTYAISGQSLLDINENKFESETTLRDAKYLFREALKPLLGYKPLASRELF